MSEWMKTARANARAMDQAMRANPYKERLRLAGEYARKHRITPKPAETAAKVQPASTENKLSGLTDVERMSLVFGNRATNSPLSDDLKTAGEDMKSTVNAKLATDGAFANTAVKKLRANGQTEAADSLKSQLDALERERHIAELRANRANEQQTAIPKPVLPQSSASGFASPGVKEIGENLITQYNAQAMQNYLGSREYAHKQETARKRAQATADSIYKEMQEYIANPNVNALDDPKILDYRNRYHAALMESVPNETQEWETEQYLDILATGGTKLLKMLEEINESRSLTEAMNKGSGGTYGGTAVGLDYGYYDDIRSLKRRYGNKVDDWLKYVSESTNRNVQQEIETEFARFGKEYPGLAYPLSVVANVVGGLGYLDAVGQKVGNLISGDDYPIDYNTPVQTFSNAASALRQGATEDMSGLGRFLYNTSASIFDSAAALATGKAGTVLLGLSTANSAMKDAAERGLPDNQTLGVGFVAGALELITESKRFERILDIQDADEAISGIEKILREGGINSKQEIITSLATISYDFLTSGDKNELQHRIRQYMDAGDAWDEANCKARKEQALSLLTDYIGGYLSGSALAGAAIAPSAIADTTAKTAGMNNDNAIGTVNWNSFNGFQWPLPYGQLRPAFAGGWTNSPVQAKESSLINKPVMYFMDKKPGSSYNQNEKSLKPQTGREWHAFNRSYANKTSDMKKGEERRIIINTEDYVYLVCADGYMHGYIADKIYILGNEEKLHRIREEFINGRTDKRGEAVNSDAKTVRNGSRGSHWDLSAAEREERTVGIDLLDEDASRSDIIGDHWESDGDFWSEEELENIGPGTMYFDGENAYERTENGWVRIPLGEDAPILSDEDKTLIEKKQTADELWEEYRIIADEEALRAIEEMKNMYYGEK